MIVAIVLLALVLGIMNYRSWKQKKDVQTRAGAIQNGPNGTQNGTRPVVDTGYLEEMPTAEMPSQMMEDLFGVTENEDMASGETDIVPVHTGIAVPTGFYATA